MSFTFHRGVLLGLPILLAACATVPTDGGASRTGTLLASRDPALAAQLGTSRAQTDAEPDGQVQRLLAEPLTADRAVAVALLKSPALHIEYARLGLAQADWLEASRLSNPVLSFAVLGSSTPGARNKLDYGITQSFTDLLLLKSRSHAAASQREQAEATAAAAIQAIATAVRQRHVEAAAASQMAQLRALIAEAADASATLAQRYHQAGNLDALALAREQANAEQARLESEQATTDAARARLALHAAMGLTPPIGWRLDPNLPAPVENETPETDLLMLARQQRLDRAASQRALAALDGVVKLAHTLRWLPFVSVGVSGEREPDGSRLLGPTVAIEIPLFGQSEAGLRRAESRRALAAAEATALDVDIARDLAEARERMEAARLALARIQTRLLPAREAVVARALEHQNYMLLSQFELLAAKQQEYDGIAAALTALRDYWLARADLHRAVGGALPSDTRIQPAAALAIPSLTPPAPSLEPAP